MGHATNCLGIRVVDSVCQGHAVDAERIVLARGVDLADSYDVGVPEGTGPSIEQRERARVCVRL